MIKKYVAILLFLTFPAIAALNVPLTVKEALYPGSTTGVARSGEAVTVGVPLPDSANITSTSVLGLSGATAAQFMIEGKWPSGNIKWLKVRAVVPSVAAGGSATVTLTDSGSGDFGGSSLATDNGATISVATGAATFTIRKANFNVLDQVVVGSKTVVASGTSQGLVVLGPDPTAMYPGNVTCSPTSGGTACTTVYASSNDSASTCTIEENGPAMSVVKCDAALIDGASHAYMKVTVREYFTKAKASVKETVSLRNAEYGTSNTFASAAKGHQGFELRLTANVAGTTNYSIATHTSTPNTGTLAASSDSVYIYQAESTLMKTGSWCGVTGCVVPSSLNGYAIVKNGSALATGTNSQYPAGWADISDATGAGIEIGQYQFAAYGNKSLEFRGGGQDVRVGMWAAENNSTSTSSTTPNRPYYMRWPQYSINDVYLNFHASAPASLSNEFLSFQHYLLARAPIAHYNSAAVFLNPLLDPTEEDSYYASVVSSASPAVTAPPNQDFGTSDVFNWLLNIWRFNPWGAGGVSNQMEFRLSYLMNFLRRGYTGGYLSAAHFYNLVADEAFPRSDGFDWRDKPGSQKDYWDFPNATSANSALTSNNQIEADGGHQYWWGMPTFYFLSGDETIKDALLDGPKDAFLDATSTNNWMTSGRAASARSVGNILSGAARMASFLSDIGDSTSAATVLNRASVVWSLQIKPELCASGYPAGCTPSQGGCDTGTAQRGTSKVRGVTFQFCETIRLNGCPGYPNNSDRTFSPFMNGILLRGMRELRAVMGPSWPDYNALTDTAYGIVQANFGEMYADNGSNSWSANGFRYKEALDVPNSCNVGSGGAGNDYNFMVQNPDAFWPLFHYLALYEGSATTNVWQRRFNQELQQVISGGSAIKDELWQMEVANVIYAILHPSGLSLATQPITGFVDNGGGSYTISWTVPPGAQSYRIKWGSKRIVDWIGFDSGANAFIGDPTTTMNWFAATDAANVPTPSGTSQSITINTGTNGLTAVNFMVKAYASGTGGTPTPPPADTTAPTVSITAPAAGSTLQGTVTVTASASDNVGVTGVQFLLDGSAVGGIVTSSPYTYSWNTSNASKGSHTISATATDAAGNIGTSTPITVSVNNTTAAPVISSVAASNVTTSEAVITWTTSTPADSQVNYGGTAGYGSVTPLVSTMVTAHVATISGLNPSTTYHFSVLSRDAQGNLATSADFTFTTSAVASGGGTAPPVGTWTALTPHGPPAQILGYDKSVYVPDTGAHCLWGAYHQIISSEMQQAVVCFNYAENRWFILETNGAWGNEHIGEAGHSLGIWAYSPDDHVIVGMSDFSGSSTSGQKWLLHWYWIDPVGLTSRDKAFTPRPLPPSSVVQSAMVYDSFNKKMILFPDANGVVETCVLSTNSCSRPTTTGTGPGNRGWQSMAYNPADHKVYLFGGTDGATHNEMYTFDAATNTWALLTTTCVGTDCVSGRPPARQAAGMAYSTVDKVFLMAGGLSSGFGSGTAFTDTWIFDPATRVWTEQSPATRYTNGTVNTTFDRVTYDEANNVFVLFGGIL